MTGFGTAARVCKSAMMLGREKGYKIGYFRPITVWPFPMKEMNKLADKVDRMLVVEMNLGQMVEDVKLATEGKCRVFFYGRPGGAVPTAEEVLEKAQLALEG